MLLWLWFRLVAVAPIQHLAWKLPYTSDAALKSKKKKKTYRVGSDSYLWDRNTDIFTLGFPIYTWNGHVNLSLDRFLHNIIVLEVHIIQFL